MTQAFSYWRRPYVPSRSSTRSGAICSPTTLHLTPSIYSGFLTPRNNQYSLVAATQSPLYHTFRSSGAVHTSDIPVMPSLLALIMPLIAFASASTVWRKALVTRDQLDAAKMTQTLQLSEEILCAIQATLTPWCHLFTHDTSGCVLYDLLVDSQANPSGEDQDAVVCKTRHDKVKAPPATSTPAPSLDGCTLI